MGIIETIKMLTREEALEEGEEKGEEKGIKRRNLEFVKTLLRDTDFDVAKIASLVGVPEAFVNQVKQEIGK